MTRLYLFLIGVGVAVGVSLPWWLITLWAQPTSLLAYIHHMMNNVMLGGVIGAALGALFLPDRYIR